MHQHPRPRSLRPLALVAGLALALTACGGGGAGTSGSSSSSSGASAGSGSGDAPTKVTVNVLPVTGAAALVLGEKEGIFEKNGLDVELKFAQITANVPAVQSGQADFAYLNAPALLAARSNGVPIRSVVTLSTPNPDPATYPIQLMVPTGSDITSPEDLEGRTVATDTLFQLPDLGMRGAMVDAGVDPSTIEFVEIPFPQMGAALESGQVDAANVTDPFALQLRESGAAQDLLSGVAGQADDVPQGIVMASEKYISANAGTVEKFAEAVAEASAMAAADPAAVQAVVPTYTQLPADLTPKLRLPAFDSKDSRSGWQHWDDLLVSQGVLKKPLDVTQAYVGDK